MQLSTDKGGDENAKTKYLENPNNFVTKIFVAF